ncbi:serine/threonine kinase-like domain-containing protein STKLD1 isoform 2-T2 [Salvelinus alpinus]|uniref:serine/threonine kinase-like domain-containing protein STKLD1 isoform X1 n=1 Tax=Salvelinus sp. IW2-2015 TaxID=2691554 RepID=UPI000CDFD822|nr:serine/threonine kinase-like domain-containing protein STKLD1 isoform X1 [Salvelinus alpinus]
MDDYMILDAMCPGCFGTVLFVKERTSDLEFTLKKVECLDEGRANQAYQEAHCLLNVRHPNIVTYKKLFIFWDESVSSVFLSMVMDCPYMTTLSTVISYHRQEEKKINKKVIKTFLGQMVDALAYLHKRSIAHRNLKPSNILMTKEAKFVIFDFGTASITGDRVKLQKRVKDCAKRWMAPESLTHHQMPEKSDIWSLGCVLLDMLTCHMLDAEGSISQLLRIREDQTSLDVIVLKGLHQVLSMMLDRNPKTRTSVWELVNEDLVKQCLLLCGSPLHAMKKTLPPGVHGLPFHQGFDSVLEFMQTYRDVESVQMSALSYLLSEERNVFYRVTDVVIAVTTAMQSHMDCAGVQQNGCQVLHQRLIAVLGQAGDGSCLLTKEVITCVLNAVHSHPEKAPLLSHAFQLLFCISGDEQAAREVLDLDGIREVLNTLRKFPEDCDIVVPCCKCLWSVLTQRICLGVVPLKDAVEAVCVAGEAHMQDSTVMESVCAALSSLTLQGLTEDQDIEDSTLLLMHALQAHLKHSYVVKYAFLALDSLVKSSELAAFRLLLTPNGGSGLVIVKEAELQHHDNPEIVGNFCSLLSAMARYGDVIPELVAEKIPDVLEQIERQFSSNKEIAQLAKHALHSTTSVGRVNMTSST